MSDLRINFACVAADRAIGTVDDFQEQLRLLSYKASALHVARRFATQATREATA